MGYTEAYANAAKEGTARVSGAGTGLDVDHVKGMKQKDPTLAGRQGVAAGIAEVVLASTSTPRCLDVGCAIGGDLGLLEAALKKQGCASYELHGVDLLEKQIEAAREVMPSGKFVTADAAKLPYADSHFDAVQCSRLLIHVPDVDTAVKEMLRVLRPGGRATLVEGDMTLGQTVTSDPIIKKVCAVKDAFTIKMCKNPRVGTELFQKLRGWSGLSVELTGYPMIMTEATFLAYEKGPLAKLVEDGQLTDEEVSYYLEHAPRLYAEGALITLGTLFVIQATKEE